MGVIMEELADACASLVPGILAAVADGRIRPVVSLVLGLQDAKRRWVTCAANRPSARSPSLLHNLAAVVPDRPAKPFQGRKS
jgi:hypothetical protein